MNLLNGIEKLKSSERSLQARRVLSQLPWPTRQQEEWRYTNLDFLAKTDWQPAGAKDLAAAKSEYALLAQEPKFKTLCFVNGVFQGYKGSDLSLRPLSGLSESELNSKDFFGNLNLAWMSEGFVLEIPAGQSMVDPICIDFYYSSEQVALAAHPLLVVKIGERSSARMIFRTFGKGTYFSNVVAKFHLAKDSQLEFVNYQSNSSTAASFSQIEFNLGESASLRSFDVSIKGKLNREKLEIYHQGANSNSQSYGLYLTQGQSQSDHYTNIEHRVGHCQSQQLYKGLLADESKGVFNGRVLIAHGAEKANSEQLNKNLLLSSKAEADSKPQLEILADDVKATHGSTVGQIDADEIFYLQSRGISKAQAIQILAQGFALEILSFVQNAEMNSYLKRELREVLKGLDL